MKDKISEKEEIKNEIKGNCSDKSRRKKNMGDGGAIYGMGLIGALIYFIQHASTFAEGVLGVLKAIFWPGILIYKVLEYLKM
ncbi:MAG: hypothetical protein OEV78_07830 [Spirochaetia bacterium]|nr:hypothetical protein [Spirochaetia bacterium]